MGKQKGPEKPSKTNLSKEKILERLEKLPNQEAFDSEEIIEYINEIFVEPKVPSQILTSAESLENLKYRLKELMITDLEKTLFEIKNVLRPDSKKYDHIVMLIVRYKRYKELNQHGLIPFQEAGLEHRTITNSAMMMINSLKAEYLNHKL